MSWPLSFAPLFYFIFLNVFTSYSLIIEIYHLVLFYPGQYQSHKILCYKIASDLCYHLLLFCKVKKQVVKNTNDWAALPGFEPCLCHSLLVTANKNKFTVIWENVNTFFLVDDRTSSYKLIKTIKSLNKMIYKFNLADIFRTLNPTTWRIYISAISESQY